MNSEPHKTDSIHSSTEPSDSSVRSSALEKKRRRFARVTAFMMIGSMSEADIGLEEISVRLGGNYEDVRLKLMALIDGDASNVKLDFISDFFFATGFNLIFDIAPSNVDREVSATEAKSE